MHQSDGVFSVYYTDRTDRSLMLAWPSAIRPIVAVEHLLRMPSLAPLALRLSRAFEQTPPHGGGCASLGFWHGSLHQNAMSAPKNGSSTATLGDIARIQRANKYLTSKESLALVD